MLEERFKIINNGKDVIKTSTQHLPPPYQIPSFFSKIHSPSRNRCYLLQQDRKMMVFELLLSINFTHSST
eukprot:m.40397 g.40397  ORF g.40397 m.40397 type:complete len:70 (+) comp6923_c0_seq1:614-823(+)